MIKIKPTYPWTALVLMLAFGVTGCFENAGSFGSSKGLASTGTGTGTGSTNLTNANSTMVISNVSIAAGSGTTSAVFTTTIFFNTAQSVGPISNYCSASASSSSSGSANACVCNFQWNENNTTSGSTVPIARSVQMPVNTVQPGLVTCTAPDAYASGEIQNGTSILISVLPGSGNGNLFPMTAFNYTRTASGTTGSFQDAQGNSYQNIARYSCYDQNLRGMGIASQLVSITNPTTGEVVKAPMASQFCVQTANGQGGVSSSQNCAGQLGVEAYSSQSYYYNLYIRDSESGDINYSNAGYYCPVVKEALGNNGSVGTQNKVWPFDKTFALSLGATSTFIVPVEGYSTLSDGGNDPVTQGSACFPSSSTPGGSSGTSSTANTLLKSCLGFAAPPNSDGTCPYFRNSNNAIFFTYRLRRYITMYPPIFDTNGLPLQQAQATDTIYVLDRPVTSPNPLVPYTMYGPNPCPFAYFDKNGVTWPVSTTPDTDYPSANPSLNNRRPSYGATNFANWTGTNIDGNQLPNYDAVNSCSAVVGVLGNNNTIMSLATVNATNPAIQQLYIRPVKAWAPHYIEDTSFQACAPQASPMVDPPLHFAKDPVTGNVGWCAETYPTQNPNLSKLDVINNATPPAFYPGHVAPYTSHAVKNSASASCNFTAISNIPSPLATPSYPAASNGGCTVGTTTNAGVNALTVNGLANHPNDFVIDPNNSSSCVTSSCLPGFSGSCPCLCANHSCDRTVSSQAIGFLTFPLLAPPAFVESAITNDIGNYGCLLSFDNSGPKTGAKSPTTGCCGPVVTMNTGVGAAGKTSAHLEPDVSCLTPTY